VTASRVVQKICSCHSSLAEGCDAVSLDEKFPSFNNHKEPHTQPMTPSHLRQPDLYVVCSLDTVSKKHAFLWMVSGVLFAGYETIVVWCFK
jgi:hypothetical protein